MPVSLRSVASGLHRALPAMPPRVAAFLLHVPRDPPAWFYRESEAERTEGQALETLETNTRQASQVTLPSQESTLVSRDIKDKNADAEGNVIQEAPLPIWANFLPAGFGYAVVEITKKTDLKISIESLERSKHRRIASVTFAIKEQRRQMVTKP
jgi:hypothetical protein